MTFDPIELSGVGLYYKPFSRSRLNADADLEITTPPESPVDRGQLRNFG